MGTRRCHPYPDSAEFPAFLTDGEPRKWRPIADDPPTPKRTRLARADWQVILILLVAIIGVLAYWRGHVDGSHAEREARAMRAQEVAR